MKGWVGLAGQGHLKIWWYDLSGESDLGCLHGSIMVYPLLCYSCANVTEPDFLNHMGHKSDKSWFLGEIPISHKHGKMGLKWILAHNLRTKMLLSNQIARFFAQHLWDQSFDILDFLRRDTESRRSDWDCSFWLGVARCAQPHPNMSRLARVLLIGLGCVATLITVHNVTWVTL